MSSFQELLKEARIRAGLSQPELAEKVGVDKSYISKLERGVESPPSRKVTLRLMDALGISDPEERNKFLIAVGVFNEEDFKGFKLVKVAQAQSARQGQAISRPIPTMAHKAIAPPLFSVNTIGGKVDRKIASANLSEEEEEELDEAIDEVTERFIKLLKKRREK